MLREGKTNFVALPFAEQSRPPSGTTGGFHPAASTVCSKTFLLRPAPASGVVLPRSFARSKASVLFRPVITRGMNRFISFSMFGASCNNSNTEIHPSSKGRRDSNPRQITKHRDGTTPWGTAPSASVPKFGNWTRIGVAINCSTWLVHNAL